MADVQLEVASPNMSVVSDVVSTVDHLGNFSLDRNETKMTIEPGIRTCFLWRLEYNFWLTNEKATKLPLPDLYELSTGL